jgi:hypothetical protein
MADEIPASTVSFGAVFTVDVVRIEEAIKRCRLAAGHAGP